MTEIGEIVQVLDQRLVVTVTAVSCLIVGSQEYQQIKDGEDPSYGYVPVDAEKKREQQVFRQEIVVERGPEGRADIEATIRAIAAVINNLHVSP